MTLYDDSQLMNIVMGAVNSSRAANPFSNTFVYNPNVGGGFNVLPSVNTSVFANNGTVSFNPYKSIATRQKPVDSSISSSAEKAAQVAERELAKGVKEDYKNNDSIDIRRYKRGAINNQQWCCYFASYCFGDGQGASNNDTFGFDASTQSVKRKAINAGCYAYKNSGYVPKRGDLAMWTKTASTGHIGVVTAVYPDGSFDVIEGNSGNAVTKHHYASQDAVGSTFNGFVKMSEWKNLNDYNHNDLVNDGVYYA